jgi:hypothetical protein
MPKQAQQAADFHHKPVIIGERLATTHLVPSGVYLLGQLSDGSRAVEEWWA